MMMQRGYGHALLTGSNRLRLTSPIAHILWNTQIRIRDFTVQQPPHYIMKSHTHYGGNSTTTRREIQAIMAALS
jgi:hypothetical protein